MQEELIQKIVDIEASVNAEMPKEDLYDKLVIAYNLQKDLIALFSNNVPEVENTSANDLAKDNEKLLQQLTEVNTKYKLLTEAVKAAGDLVDKG